MYCKKYLIYILDSVLVWWIECVRGFLTLNAYWLDCDTKSDPINFCTYIVNLKSVFIHMLWIHIYYMFGLRIDLANTINDYLK